MKRKILFIIIIVCLSAATFGARRSRSVIQKIIQLTTPKTAGKISFEETLSRQRITSRFTGQALDRTIISQLAWAGVGNRQTPPVVQFTPQPLQSTFPVQLFFATNEGVFFYQPLTNSLEQIVEGDVRSSLATTTPASDSIASAGCVVIITSTVTRAPGSRRGSTTSSNRNAMLLEAGHIAQNIQLQAVSLEQDISSIAISDFEAAAVEKACSLPRDFDALYMVCVGYLTAKDKEGAGGSPSAPVSKRAAIIVPSANFEDAEFFETIRILDAAKIRTAVVSNRIGPIKGMGGGLFEVQYTADKIRVDDFDGIVIIGGTGAAMFFDDKFVLNILREAFRQRKVIGATSGGILVLANAGILKGVKVAGLIADIGVVQNSGAVFTNMPVEKDMRIITCAGPVASQTFAVALADTILGK